MFDSPTPKGAPVEDIFADTEALPRPAAPQPSAPVPPQQSPAVPPAAMPQVTAMPTEPLPTMEPESSSRRFLPWIVVGVVVVAGAAVAAWYFFFMGPSSVSEIPAPTPLAPEAGLPPAESGQVPPAVPAAPADTDGDGLLDDEEGQYGTDVMRADSDEDGLFDKEEVKIYQTNPLNPDSDGDGFSDGEEVQNGYNPLGSGRLLELPATLPPGN